MKTFKLFTVLTCIAALFLSSCMSDLTISKRRYNKGYYVHLNHKKHAEIPAAASAAHQNTIKDLVIAEEKVVAANASFAKPAASSVKNIPQKTRVNKSAANTEFPAKALASAKKLGRTMVFKPIDFPALKDRRMAADSAGGAVFDIIWLIIIVLLVLYLLGLLLDVAGGSWLIHLLALIILILLIFKLVGMLG